MSVRKNKLAVFVALAVVSALLLGGVSFTFFPSQTGPAPPPQVSIPNVPNAYTPRLTITSANTSLNQGTFGNNLTYSIISNSSVAHIMWTAFRTQPLDSIVIAPDGTVNSTAIMRDGDTYKFTGNVVNQTLIIQRSNIIVDGNNHSLKGFTQSIIYALENIHLENVSGVTIKNLNVRFSWQGITVLNCTNITIQNNTIIDANTGIYLTAVRDSTITNNTFNNMTAAVYNLSVNGYSDSYKLTVTNNTISSVATGVSLAFSLSNTITDNVIVNTSDSIFAGVNSTIARNTLIGGNVAISVVSNNHVYDNTIINFNDIGIILSGLNSVIYQNTLTACVNAVMMDGSSGAYPVGNNTFYHNNFLNNTQPLMPMTNSSLATAQWDNGKEGNYWTNNNATDSNGDGISDTPFQVGIENVDRYPLMDLYVLQTSSYDFGTGNLLFIIAGVIGTGAIVVLGCTYVAKKWTPTPKTPT